MSLTKIITASLLIGSSMLAVTPASADEIDRRQDRQQSRIQHGVRSGEITRSEYQRLEAEQARIAAMERRAKADGYVSGRERAEIREAQNEASRHIRHESHDSERRGSRWWR